MRLTDEQAEALTYALDIFWTNVDALGPDAGRLYDARLVRVFSDEVMPLVTQNKLKFEVEDE